ncbi:ABC transporter permease [Actinoplanes sp. NPDC051411]|uniref:ABC transporter permease n=1 Tax=Actinoplanes sp. NPDC051411 TaxID=3155522 RepID=UPI00341AF7D5
MNRLGHESAALLGIAQRDLVKLLRDRPRLAVNLAFPILLIVGLGNVLQSSVGVVTGLDAVALAFTGVLAATLFQSTAAGMISIAQDRENDFTAELFVAPVSRFTLLFGKIIGESAVAVFQGLCVLLVAALIGVRTSPDRIGVMALTGLLCCLLGGAFGLVVLAVTPNQRSAMDIFQFFIIPQYVLAGVLAPLHDLPGYLDVIAWAMPLRYAVGLMRSVYFAGSPGYDQVVVAGPAVDSVVLIVLTAVLLGVGVVVFDHRERHR